MCSCALNVKRRGAVSQQLVKHKMQACVGKEKGLSRNQIPRHTCSPSMSITLPLDLNEMIKL